MEAERLRQAAEAAKAVAAEQEVTIELQGSQASAIAELEAELASAKDQIQIQARLICTFDFHVDRQIMKNLASYWT